MVDDVAHLLESLDAPVRAIVDRLREVIAESIPDASQETDLADRLIASTYRPGTYTHLIAAIAPQATHVSLMLAKGAELVDLDTHGLLEGTGKKARHITFRTTADVDRPGVRELLAEAARRTPRP